ncbi:acyl-CoA dehydrogenase family protein [Sphingopyxis sp. OPL5]|uniref:acyl-CoA dehydrogenase family protein n=1 Tax=Sphingopyxis sp. OPL5 TaxID=2486273 RepID=UPI00164E1349|nr:acyl-CoA dehydrogenase family protein [Sphingopyxis sp. OPL5]QNO25571.1 acyl-CoA dehydrogenase family protein [Sphingopyxis sp. OPL5]
MSQAVESLVERTAAFVRDELIPLEQDGRWGSHGPSSELVDDMRSAARAAGLIAPHLARAGRPALSMRDTARLFRAAGYSPLGPVALNIAAPDEGNMHLLERVASEAQKADILEPLASGFARSVFLMTEPDNGAGSDPSLMKTRAERIDGGWRISGRKWLITGATGARFAIIMAMTEAGPTMFLSDMERDEIVIERVLDTLDSALPGGHAVISLNGLVVADADVLGEVGQGLRYAQVRLAPARLTHCMRWTGAAQRAHDVAARYACERMAFGKPLIDHEGVGFMLADNLIDLKSAELLTDWCADILDAGGRGSQESSMAKVAVSEALYRVADRCVQILGGLGVTRDTIVERVFRELRAFRIYDGPSEVHRWSIANKIKQDIAAQG